MKKGLKYTLICLGCLVVLAGVGLGIMYVVSPYKVKRWLGIVSSYSDVFVDRLKGQPYTHGGYDGIDVSKHNGVIKWKEIAKNKRIIQGIRQGVYLLRVETGMQSKTYKLLL